MTIGLQGDAIQPLTLRVNQGECLRLTLRNDLAAGEPASLHLHGSGLLARPQRRPGAGHQPGRDRRAGGDGGLRVGRGCRRRPEGTHVLPQPRRRPRADQPRPVRRRGRRARRVDATATRPPATRCVAGGRPIIQDPAGSDFREFVLYYHEVGNERYRHLDRQGRPVVQVDPFTTSYRPGDRAMNYRSEPFMNRLRCSRRPSGRVDKSVAYSSYAFGDPATPMPRSYLGDPVKQRVDARRVGGVPRAPRPRRRHPLAAPAGRGAGRVRRAAWTSAPPCCRRRPSAIDSQAIGPSETYDVTNECGSGGCQQSAGDYLVHCHVAHHYLSGMWGIWRVYNTRQDGPLPRGRLGSLDGLPALAELPDRPGRVLPAVTSRELVGTDGGLARADVPDHARRPGGVGRAPASAAGRAPGLRRRRAGLARGRRPVPERARDRGRSWPGYRSRAPRANARPWASIRRPGKLAYPFLRPHLGKRPPFAPGHGPAPFLDPMRRERAAPAPGANGPWSLCPAGTRPKTFTVHAITLPVTLNRGPAGRPGGTALCAQGGGGRRPRRQRRSGCRWRSGPTPARDCVDVLFKSELEDTRENGFLSKANIHIHFVQFDVQASDGVSTGFNYEQSVRPFTVEGEALDGRRPPRVHDRAA